MVRASLLVAALLAAGCQYRDPGAPRLSDVRSAIGKMTYAEAVKAMGAPRSRHEFHDGSVTAEWVVGRRVTPRVSFGLPVPDNAAESDGQTLVDRKSRPVVRRMEFGPDGRLVSVREATD
jgi:hypothetical protein